ncbi:FAD-dependent oxidoreductase [Conexibacter stalactiti]|uniref:FAD-dependent oxidoreductase n=1 Tax=Conexibacter stalactiti TaxID=1940611 RepID=A0ABU4HTK5_9ACTN|nr:FAD-dependent oxidoreductase [Conexibacter stalactiti]MDW5596002.1 FAD-dependent oxidoreductase [Conexibacter stalactiti]MEC5036644.1 FAD-dependent oxidoreductase [Conexibacter stalactiti]
MSGADRRDADVAIVGAGISGLHAARLLTTAGRDVVVLEGRDRIGGRTVSAPIGDGRQVELGGQFIGPTHRRVAALLRELEIDTFPTYDDGRNLLDFDGSLRDYDGAIPPLGLPGLVGMGIAEWRLNRMARQVSPHQPWAARRAAEWDGTTFGAWLDQHGPGGRARTLLDLLAGTVWGAEPHELNLLQALAYASAAGGLRETAGVKGGMQERRIDGGPAQLCAALAARAGALRLSTPVREIAHRRDDVELRADGLVVRAAHAIVAVPPALVPQIAFEPALPAARDRVLRRLPSGRVTKVVCVYPEPFWRDRGLSGQAVSDGGPVGATFDNSPPDGRPGVLLGFVTGDRAATFATLPEPDRRQLVTAQFARLFGAQAARPEQYLERDWAADPFARGCYFGLAGPGAIGEAGTLLSQPLGRIHWAGAETTVASYGGMDGAVLAGDRVAREVLG